ncbi:hypothetical protein [Streptacidiphilus cavernicola]|uniref:Uncharacterized protein n=1 Tax=Streptacidiphilus cavernicola TaxID=3342716 RepID=A0ABV6VY52_9ACTN
MSATATIYVDDWSSRCPHCGAQTLPQALTHDRVSGWLPGPGCGALFTAIASGERPVHPDVLAELRPDLPVADTYIDPAARS